MRITAHTRVFGLLGHPVRHSRSPEIHNQWFAQYGVDAVYVAFEVPPSSGPDLAGAIRALGLAGVNLTVPYKADVLASLDSVDAVGVASGAVNVVVQEDGRLHGYNTDGAGLVAALRAEFGPCVAGRRTEVIGAGGAGRAVAAGLAAAGASTICLRNRTIGKAEAAVRTLRRAFPQTVFDAGPLVAPGSETQLVVNCTSGPGAAVVAALDTSALGEDAIWCDINYWMDAPPQVEILSARGVRVQTGLPMLLHQAALAFEHFTGVRPEIQMLGGDNRAPGI